MTAYNSYSYQYTAPEEGQRFFEARGAALQLLYCKDDMVLLEGPAGTGKSRALLEKLFILMDKYPGCRLGLFRKTRRSLTQTSMVTWEREVCPPGLIGFHTQDQEYRHPNGSILAVGGLDKSSKIMSAQYDVIAVPEATEITEGDADDLTTRLRNGVMPYQQLIMDCNPAGPLHWLNLACKDKGGDITRLRSKHRDNPRWWDLKTDTWTAQGKAYLMKLRRLSGVRFWRFFKGIWRQAEGMVYEEWDESKHLLNPRVIPKSWPRYWVIDFGYTAPFCWQEWAMDGDGRLYLCNEVYHTRRLVADHAKSILQATSNVAHRPRAIICDHDAEGRATLEREMGLKTIPAWKQNKLESIEAVRRRLRVAGDDLPRMFLQRGTLWELDSELKEAKLPTCTVEEFEGYVWDDKSKKERPKDENDHGMNCIEYVVSHVDKLGVTPGGGAKQTSGSTGKTV